MTLLSLGVRRAMQLVSRVHEDSEFELDPLRGAQLREFGAECKMHRLSVSTNVRLLSESTHCSDTASV